MGFRAALVTGASSGIGEAIALALPAATDLLLTGRDAGRLTALAARLAAPGRRVAWLAVDLAAPGGPEAVAARAEDFGVDLLVNNAGLGRFGPFVGNDPAAEREMVTVNVLAPVVITRALLPGMIARARAGGGRAGLILVGSIVGFAAMPYFSTYAATKAFDIRLAQGLAAELAGEPVDVLALCPGSTETRFFERSRFASRLRPAGHGAARVAREGLAALGRRPLHVVGAGNRLLALAFKLLPGRLILPLVAAAMRPPKNR